MNDATTAPGIGPAKDVEPLEDEAGQDPAPEFADPDAERSDSGDDATDEVVEAGSELEPEPEPEPEAEPEPEPEPEPGPEPEPEVADETAPVPEADATSEAEPGAEDAPGTALSLDELVADIARSEAPAEEADAEPADEEPPTEGVAEVAETAESAEEAATAEAPEAQMPILQQLWTRAPFWALDFIWLSLTVSATIALWRAPSATFADGPAYGMLVLGGAAMAFIGLVSGLVVWLIARSRVEEDARVGLGLAIWTRALAWTAGGVALWWVGLLLLDMHHAGVIG